MVYLQTQLIFVRHGQTDWNKKNLIQGQSDVPLNEIGRKQATEKADFFIKRNFDIAYSSPLVRAYETGQIILKNSDIKICKDIRLKERNFGLIEGHHVMQIRTTIRKLEIDSTIEKDELLEKRLADFIQDVLKLHQGKTIIIIAHSHVIKAAQRVINPQKPLEYSTSTKNLSVFDFTYNYDTRTWVTNLLEVIN